MKYFQKIPMKKAAMINFMSGIYSLWIFVFSIVCISMFQKTFTMNLSLMISFFCFMVPVLFNSKLYKTYSEQIEVSIIRRKIPFSEIIAKTFLLFGCFFLGILSVPCTLLIIEHCVSSLL